MSISGKEHLLDKFGDQLVELDHKVFDGTTKRILHLSCEGGVCRNANIELRGGFTLMDRLALFVTERVGTFGFFLLIAFWTVIWFGWNTFGPFATRFDPAPAFVLWLFISNVIQLVLTPLIMVGQNLQGRHAELRAETEFEVNQKSEKQIEAMLLRQEHQEADMERQGELLMEIAGELRVLRKGEEQEKSTA